MSSIRILAVLLLSAFCLSANDVVTVGGKTKFENPVVVVRDDGAGGYTAGGSNASATTSAAPTDVSGTITAGGTSQTLAAAKSGRVYLEIQNISDTVMYINFGAAAVVDSNSFRINAGGSYVAPASFCPSTSVTVICATAGKKFVAKEY